MSITDTLMLRYYELLSRISLEELKELKKGIENGTVHPKTAKENLALEIVERYRGKDAALNAKEEFGHIFGKDKGLPDDIQVFELKWEEEEMWIPKIMKLSGLTASTGEAMRVIKQGGLKIDDQKCDNPDAKLKKEFTFLRQGRESF